MVISSFVLRKRCNLLALTMNTNQCPICQDDIQSPVGITNTCRHSFCYSCLEAWTYFNMTCPLDRTPFNEVIILQRVGGPIVQRVRLCISALFQNETSDVLINHPRLAHFLCICLPLTIYMLLFPDIVIHCPFIFIQISSRQAFAVQIA